MNDKKQPLLAMKTGILETALKIVPFDGWSEETLVKASKETGYTEGTSRLLFPGGVIELVDLFCAENDTKMIEAIKNWDNAHTRVRDKIANAIRERLKIYSQQKAVILKTISFLMMPFYTTYTTAILWRIIDHIWHEAGQDKSTDYNYYTKRMLLSGVYISTVLFWLQDSSENYTETDTFLERRIENVMSITKLFPRSSK